MRVSRVCSRHVISTKSATALTEAAALMRKHQIGALVVVEDTPAGVVPAGILTDRDFVVGVIAADVDPRVLTVADIMTRSVVTCREDHDLFDAIEIMRQRGVRRLPVTNRDGVLVGILTADDVVGAMAEYVGALAGAFVNDEIRESQRLGA